MSPTQRTLAALRVQGQIAQVVERWNPHARKRVDFLGFIDIIAVGEGITGIQCTSDSNVAARVKKIREECQANAFAWLYAGGAIQVWGWGKKGPRGKRKTWQSRIVNIAAMDI
jgi:hypothetical protein